MYGGRPVPGYTYGLSRTRSVHVSFRQRSRNRATGRRVLASEEGLPRVVDDGPDVHTPLPLKTPEDRIMNKSLVLASLVAAVALAACGKKPEPTPAPAPAAAPAPAPVADAAASAASAVAGAASAVQGAAVTGAAAAAASAVGK